MKKCPYCAEEIQDEAIVCRFCGRDLKPVETPVQVHASPKMTRNKKEIVIAVVFVIVAIVAAVVFKLFIEKGDGGSSNTSPTNTDPSRNHAIMMCEKFVEDRLKAPSTAEFPPLDEAEVELVGVGAWIVRSYVDAQNSFGAMMRTNYVCYISRGGNDEWTLHSLETQP